MRISQMAQRWWRTTSGYWPKPNSNVTITIATNTMEYPYHAVGAKLLPQWQYRLFGGLFGQCQADLLCGAAIGFTFQPITLN
jgi:hypothetical protein